MLRSFSFCLLFCAVAAPAYSQMGSGNACIYRSVEWRAETVLHRTEISSRAQGECKEISYAVNGVEQTGLDCNCDLIADGQEGIHLAPPARISAPLIEVCRGPIADPLLYDRPTTIEVIDE